MHRLHNYSCATSLRISVKPFSNYNTNCKITILYIKHTCKNVTVCALITSESACDSKCISNYSKKSKIKITQTTQFYLGDFYGGGGGGGDNPDSFKSVFYHSYYIFFSSYFSTKML